MRMWWILSVLPRLATNVNKRKDDEARAKILDQLTAEAQELGMGY